MVILSIILAIVITAAFFIVRNLVKQTERLEDFITVQSEAIVACGVKLKALDHKGTFHSDDEIGFFFKAVEEIQEALNEFTLK
jgi:hypothetical protein